jgi:glycosyltransferase involved in cell wall biosynthesis/SAM-dependent methyltransferase
MTNDSPDATYDAEYFSSHCGLPYQRGGHGWEQFFGGIADRLVAELDPSSVLDAGCAIGFLVEALRERGVDATGIDVSEYAISDAPDELKPYLQVASVADELSRRYDLITCIEVLEHLDAEQGEEAIANFARHTDVVLFSSSPDDHEEPTHVNVQPPGYWASLFARHGFFRDFGFDASFVTPQAMLMRRTPPSEFAKAVETALAKSALELLRAERDTARAVAVQERQLRLDLERERLELRGELVMARAEAAEFRTWQKRGGWRIYVALFALRVRVAPAGGLGDRLLRKVLGATAGLLEASAGLRRLHVRATPSSLKAVLYLSGCPGDAFRYRAEHQVQELDLAGATADSALIGEFDTRSALDGYAAIVLHRVPWDRLIEGLVSHAERCGIPVLFDTDDLVFEPDAAPYVAALVDMDMNERALFLNGLARYRRTLSAVSAATVSTESLAEAAAGIVGRVAIAPNAVSDEMVRGADVARFSRRTPDATRLAIAYFSGTATHNRDFLEAADAVLWALATYPSLRFIAVGHLALDSRFDSFGKRVERIPLQPWRDLPQILAGVDVNLAPLEPDNPFTEAKSCLKYLEAGLLSVPTIASPRRDFARVMRHGENGLFADTAEAWKAALATLLDSAEIRQRIGMRAHEDVIAHHTTRARARPLHRTLAELCPTPDAPLTVNWILRAPIAQRGGGYRTIFRIADGLARRGHRSRVYVEPIAHLAGKSETEIRAFVESSFGPLATEVIVGHNAIARADISLATNWPTAHTVARHRTSLFKAYFIQDYEPHFYDAANPLRSAAEATYDLPLRHVTYGAQLALQMQSRTGLPADSLDFALEPEFQLTTLPEERPEPVKVLFLARPDQPRRGFDIGLKALQLLHERVPAVEISLYGSPDAELPATSFPFTNRGVLSPSELAEALNECHVFLSFSLTNISHAPYEAMACGCAVIETDLPHVRAMLAPDSALLATPEANDVAVALERLVNDRATRLEYAHRGIEAVAGMSWDRSIDRIEEILRSLAFLRLPKEPRL